MSSMTQETIQQIVNSSCPERLSLEERPPISDDHIIHIFRLTQWGQTTLAADHLLFPEMSGILSKTVSAMIKQLNILFASSKPIPDEAEELFKKKVHLRQYAYETLLEMAINFYGLESQWLQEEGKTESLQSILSILEKWENLERKEGESSIARAVVEKWLARMKRVQKGNSMVAKTALSIESNLDFKKNFLLPFLKKAEMEIKGNIYTRMVKEGKCKFGNDYALGLRWLRHLGFEQVSTNPVLAAKAYQDEPSLAEMFKEEAKHHPNFKKWSANPSFYAEEIALFATLLSLWDNLYVFRPIFFNLRETSGGGVVSFQLNPNIAHLVEESIREVFLAFSLASENLTLYDHYLLAGYRINGERGRPNWVIKVAATSPAARIITRTINTFGLGSNITLDYSVSQEVTLLLEEMEGMSGAIKKEIRPTQLYMTNMGGRLESHLREVKLEELFQELRKKMGKEKAMEKVIRLSESNETKDKVSKAKTYEEKVIAATRYTHGQKTINEFIYEALKEVASKESLQHWEEAIGKSGTLVARRMWEIFFSEKNREKWINYLMKKNSLTRNQAQLIMDRLHYLPASKRKPFDTYWTLSSRNLVHTEFPDHQEKVRKMAEEPQFNLKDYEESISNHFSPDAHHTLNQIKDFRKAYEINQELKEIFQEVGISEGFGLGGLLPSDWAQFGPVQKTLSEFKSAYDQFEKDMISTLQGLMKKKHQTKEKKDRKEEKEKMKKKNPIKISICNELFQGWPIEKVFEYTAQLGYDGVEIAPYTLADSVTEISPKRRKAIRQAAEENGIEIVGLHWLLAKPEGLYINHPDEIIRIQTQEYIEALIHFCADIGGNILVHGSPHQRTVQEGWDFQESWDFAKETFKICLKAARKRNVLYCIEPLAHTSTNFINTVAEAIQLVKEIRHPNIKMVFDCRSASAQEKSVPEALLRASDSGYLRHVHVNDANGRGPGFGETEFIPVLKSLVKSGYKGYISVEVFDFSPDPQTVASRSIGYLRGILETLTEKG